jgi:hypothetical protein
MMRQRPTVPCGYKPPPLRLTVILVPIQSCRASRYVRTREAMLPEQTVSVRASHSVLSIRHDKVQRRYALWLHGQPDENLVCAGLEGGNGLQERESFCLWRTASSETYPYQIRSYWLVCASCFAQQQHRKTVLGMHAHQRVKRTLCKRHHQPQVPHRCAGLESSVKVQDWTEHTHTHTTCSAIVLSALCSSAAGSVAELVAMRGPIKCELVCAD